MYMTCIHIYLYTNTHYVCINRCWYASRTLNTGFLVMKAMLEVKKFHFLWKWKQNWIKEITWMWRHFPWSREGETIFGLLSSVWTRSGDLVNSFSNIAQLNPFAVVAADFSEVANITYTVISFCIDLKTSMLTIAMSLQLISKPF